jgi:hypothetical protein
MESEILWESEIMPTLEVVDKGVFGTACTVGSILMSFLAPRCRPPYNPQTAQTTQTTATYRKPPQTFKTVGFPKKFGFPWNFPTKIGISMGFPWDFPSKIL